jgi:signal transduction histidine kinase
LRLAEDLGERITAALENARSFRQANEAIVARDRFLSLAAHELRTPLTSLRLSSEMIERELASQPAADHVVATSRVMVRQVERLNRLVNRIIDASQLGVRRLPICPEHIDLARLAHQVTDGMDGILQRAECPISVQGDAPVMGWWDPTLLDEAITNLLDNAIKFGAGKPIAVSVRIVSGKALVSVRDEGIGIAPEVLREIFGRYVRGVSESSFGGLGLGLYIVRAIAEAHGGNVQVDSRVGAGTTVTLELPAEAQPLSLAEQH